MVTQPCKQAGPDLLERDKGPSAPLLHSSLPFLNSLPQLLFLEIRRFFLLFILCGVKGLGEYSLGLGMSEKLKSRKEWLQCPVPNTAGLWPHLLGRLQKSPLDWSDWSLGTCRPPTRTT